MYKIIDNEGVIYELFSRVENKNIPISERLNAEKEYLGYIDYINPKAAGYGYITEINTKYTPRLSLYKLDTGETVYVKMFKKEFGESGLKEGDVIKFTTQQKPKSKLVDGKWIRSTEEFDDWIKSYTIYER